MTTAALQGRAQATWEQRLYKEELSASATRGAPFYDQSRLLDFMADRSLSPDPDRKGAPVHLSKGRAGYAWRDYSQGHNPVAGFNTRWMMGDATPYYSTRAQSATTDSFPSLPRMQGALMTSRSIAQLHSQAKLPPVSPTLQRSMSSSSSLSPSPARTGRRFQPRESGKSSSFGWITHDDGGATNS